MSVRRSLAVLVCWTLLLGVVAPTAATGATTTPAEPVAGPGDGTVAPAVGPPAVAAQANNTTVRHRNPDGRDADGDLRAVQEHLADEMGEIVVDCSRSVGTGEFDPCERLNGSYSDSLSKFVEVSRETGTGADDATGRDLRRTRREGREYARTVRRFRETYDSYREARANGNAARARREARELRALAADAERTGGNLTRSLRNVTRGGADVSAASRAVNGTTENVTRTVAGIEGDLFVETATTARANASSASFLDPLVVTGRVTKANGTAVPGASVGLSRVRNGSVADRVRARARTDTTGHYRLVYRPVTVPTGRVTLAVRLLPSASSAYLPSNATVPARIEQVQAEFAVLSAPGSVAYDDRVRVRVRATVDGTAAGRTTVDGLPVTTRVDGIRLGDARTGADGEAVTGGRLPADVPPGERTLTVGLGTSGRAVAAANASVPVDVRETATTLSATARAVNRSVRVDGRLGTAEGRPLARRPVRVTLDGRLLGTLRTRPNGSFGGQLRVPEALLPVGEPAERDLRVAFDGDGGNLAPAETATTVTFPAAGEAPLDDSALALSMVASVLVAVAGVLLLARRRSRAVGTPDAPGTDRSGTETTVSDPVADHRAALDAVRAAMEAGDYDLVTTAGYRAVRRALADRVDAGPDATHWEFYGACAADGIDPGRLEAVRGLTERFERVAFAPDAASRSVAVASLADAEAVLGTDSGGVDGGADDGGADDDGAEE